MKIINILLLFSCILLLSNSILLNNNPFNKKCLKCPNCAFGYIGGGALIYESNNGIKNFILGIDCKNELVDFGDKINSPNERIWISVSEILNIKTLNVLNTKPNDIIINDYIDIDCKEHKYRCYLVKIDNFDIYKYKCNKYDFDNKFKKYFNEIHNIIIISETSIKNLLDKEYNNANNSPELIPYMISSRLKKILYIYFYEQRN